MLDMEQAALKLTDSNLMLDGDYRTEEVVTQLPTGGLGVSYKSLNHDPKVVWLTSNLTPSPKDHYWSSNCHYDKLRIRIAVEVDAVKWTDWVKGFPTRDLNYQKGLIASGGDYKSWYVYEQEIPIGSWEDVTDTATGERIYERLDPNAPVTKDDVAWAASLKPKLGLKATDPAYVFNVNTLEKAVDFSFENCELHPNQTWKEALEECGAFERDHLFVFKPYAGVYGMEKTVKAFALIREDNGFNIKFVSRDETVHTVCADIPATNAIDIIDSQEEGCKRSSFLSLAVACLSFLKTRFAYVEKRSCKGLATSKPHAPKTPTDIFVAIYRRPERIEKKLRERAAKEGRKLLYEQPVPGYWRNQYYASTKSHARIFVKDYTRGPKGVPDLRNRIYKAVR
jgi:hypothetical protein